jgi:hypothetical protein
METDTLPLADAIAVFVEAHGMSSVTFGRQAMNDPHFVRDINAGRRVWPETDQRARAFMASYVPVATQAAA